MEAVQKYAELLAASHDTAEAVKVLEEMRIQNPAEFLQLNGQILLGEGFSVDLVRRAAIQIQSILKRRLTGNKAVKELWFQFPEEQQAQIQQALFRGLMFDSRELVDVCSAALGCIAKIKFDMSLLTNLCTVAVNEGGTYPTSAAFGALMTIREIFDLQCIHRVQHNRLFPEIQERTWVVAQGALKDAPVPFKVEAAKLIVGFLKTFVTSRRDVNFRKTVLELLIANWDLKEKDLHDAMYRVLKCLFTAGRSAVSPEELQLAVEMLKRDAASGDQNIIMASLKFWRAVAKDEASGPRNRESLIALVSEVLIPLLFEMLVAVEDRDPEDFSDEAWLNSLGMQARLTLRACAKVVPQAVFVVSRDTFRERVQAPHWKVVFGACSGIVVVAEIPEPEVTEFLAGIMEPIIGLCSSPVKRVQDAAFCALGSIIRNHDVFPSPAAEAEFVTSLFTQAINADPITVHDMCYVLRHSFIKASSRYDSPFASLLPDFMNTFMTMLAKPDHDNVIADTACALVGWAPPSTKDTLIALLEQIIGVLNNAPRPFGTDHVPFLWVAQSIIEKLRICRNAADGVVDGVITSCYAFFQGLITSKAADNVVSDVVKCISACFYASPDIARAHFRDIIALLAEMQRSRDLTLIEASCQTISDTWSEAAGDPALIEYAPSFIELLMSNIDQLSETGCLPALLVTLGDVVSFSDAASLPFRDAILVLIDTLTNFWNPETESDIRTVTPIWEGVLHLSMGIFRAYPADVEFYDQHKQILFGLFQSRRLDARQFNTPSTWNAVCDFLEAASRNSQTARHYNTLLNLQPITDFLTAIEKDLLRRGEKLPSDVTLLKRVKALRQRLPKL